MKRTIVDHKSERYSSHGWRCTECTALGRSTDSEREARAGATLHANERRHLVLIEWSHWGVDPIEPATSDTSGA